MNKPAKKTSAETSDRVSVLTKMTRAVRNRGARPRVDGGLLLGSSRIPIRLRSFGHQHTVKNFIAEDQRGEILAFGGSASKLMGRTPVDISVRRPFREGRVEDLDASRELLEKLISESRHRVMFGPRMVVGVASHLTNLERKTIEEVVKAAGARHVSLVECCLLNVIGYEKDPFAVQGHLVVDLGAGHGEVALVSSGAAQALRTIPDIGHRMDQAIARQLKADCSIEVSARQAEAVKKTLGSALEPTQEETMDVTGCDLSTGLPCQRTVTNFTVYRALSPLLQEVANEVKQVLKSVPSGYVSDVAKSGGLLVGGVANLKGLAEYLEAATHLTYVHSLKPETVTQRGLDRLLHEPSVRKRLLNRKKIYTQADSRRGRATEKLVGIVAVALLLVASYFPAEQVNGFASLDSLRNSVMPVWNYVSAPAGESAQVDQGQSAELAEKDRRLKEMTKENKRLAALAKSESAIPNWAAGKSVNAKVIARPPSQFNEQLLVDVGKKQGVAPGMVVTSKDGLIGRISRVEEMSSYLQLLGKGSEELGGRIARTSSAGVVSPSSEGGYEITYIDPNDGVKVGDLVETSGLDGVYPGGVPLGKVTRLRRPDGEVYLTADIEPSVDLDEVQSVMLLDGKSV